MSSFQKIKLEGLEYYIIDSIQNLRAEDSFIHRRNKLAMYKGNGEARKYVGDYRGKSGERLSNFFEYEKWGQGIVNNKRVYTQIQDRCFFSKSNLLRYLYDTRVEYQQQEQEYNCDISNFYNERVQTLTELTTDKIHFTIYDVSDLIGNKKRYTRGYIRSDEPIWNTWRNLILPKISYLSILKLIPTHSTKNDKPIFYFRIFLDYEFRSIVHPQLLSADMVENVTETLTVRKKTARIGQPRYRKTVLKNMPQCPFTKISDNKLLIASHIKPYQVCINEDKVNEAVDGYNGLALSPTYDKLFDQGYITFTDKGELVCGTQLNSDTWEKLNIDPNAKAVMPILPNKRRKYLEYHRQNVFQDNIDDFI